MRGALTLSVAAAALMALSLPANAQADDDCKPSDAWTETVPAQGEPTILVDNPDYEPAKEAVYRTEHHPEQVVEGTTTYLRYVWKPKGQVAEGQTPDVTGSNPMTEPDNWQANTSNYEGAGHGNPLNEAFHVATGGPNGSWFYWRTFTSGSVIEAWDEEVLVTEAVPAKGEPKIEKKNPNYKPASTIEHPAVVCDAPTPAGTTTPTGLAATGANAGTLALVAAALALVGTAVVVVTRRLAASRH